MKTHLHAQARYKFTLITFRLKEDHKQVILGVIDRNPTAWLANVMGHHEVHPIQILDCRHDLNILRNYEAILLNSLYVPDAELVEFAKFIKERDDSIQISVVVPVGYLQYYLSLLVQYKNFHIYQMKNGVIQQGEFDIWIGVEDAPVPKWKGKTVDTR